MKRREGAPVLGAIIESAAEASRDFPSFRRFAGLVSQVYGSSYGDYLTPSERAEYGDLHFEAEAVVGLYLDAAASARRQGETDPWERWAQEASGVAASVLALAVKIRQGLREEELQRRSALVSLARAAGLPEEEARGRLRFRRRGRGRCVRGAVLLPVRGRCGTDARAGRLPRFGRGTHRGRLASLEDGECRAGRGAVGEIGAAPPVCWPRPLWIGGFCGARPRSLPRRARAGRGSDAALLRSARGTKRDIPASFLRSRCRRLGES